MKNLGSRLLAVLFALALLAGGVAFLLAPKKTTSEAERRPLAEVPQPRAQTVLSGAYFSGLSAYVTDHFPAREFWRALKAGWQLDVMRETENNGLLLSDGYIVKPEKEISDESFDYAAARLGAVYDRYLSQSDCRVYAALVPDKGCFLAASGYPAVSLSAAQSRFAACLPEARFVSLADTLTLSDYYRTDSHWRQEALLPVAGKLLAAMDAPGDLPEAGALVRNTYAPFSGVYAGQLALPQPPETLVYLTGGALDTLTATDLVTRAPVPVYDPDGCDPRDPYTLFVGGSRALLRIENPASGSDRELIVFRDSFGSALAPLLACGYRAVTLADTRYIAPEAMSRYLRFQDCDVLFLYSFTLLNHSQGLR